MLHQLGRDALGLSDHFELLGELGPLTTWPSSPRRRSRNRHIEQMHHLLRRQIYDPCVVAARLIREPPKRAVEPAKTSQVVVSRGGG